MALIARRGIRGIYKLYVGNIPWTVSNNELRQYFEKFGPVKSAIVKFDSNTGLTKHFGFVHFFERDTYRAVQAEESHLLENVRLTVSTVTVGIQTPQYEQPNRDSFGRRHQAISDDD
ncbi:hypothetical protein CHS0354_032474 [Potamilus streckersoni]|uniref:RRM domain-containing protein n=1 Tax=Potamilus streckersoni TaxID=2493646 RepID=A0AAE0SQS7_9BIVA|nr:hypothetical protein CHS0354_032474 [Potamilus streckersoni]